MPIIAVLFSGGIVDNDDGAVVTGQAAGTTQYINLQFSEQPEEDEEAGEGSTILLSTEHGFEAGQGSQYVVVSSAADSKVGIQLHEVVLALTPCKNFVFHSNVMQMSSFF